MKNIVIAVDGPAGAGKSTISKIVAKKLGINYIDTGAMYRAATLKCINEGISLDDHNGVISVVSKCDITFDTDKILLDGIDVSEDIRTPEVSSKVSYVSKVSEVREILVDKQRKIGSRISSILDGRDIGTVVFPNADYKFFLVADPRERGLRRYREMIEKNILPENTTVDMIVDDIIKRDKIDSTRDVSPLKKADDAMEVDTTNMSIDDVVEFILSRVNR